MKRFFAVLLSLIQVVGLSAATFVSDGSNNDVNAKIALAVAAGGRAGIVTVPAPGTYSWSSVDINGTITLQPSGPGLVTINCTSSAGVVMSGGGRMTGFTVNGLDNGGAAILATGTALFRLDHMVINSGVNAGRTPLDESTISTFTGMAE